MKKGKIRKGIASMVAVISVIGTFSVSPIAVPLSESVFTKKPKPTREFVITSPAPSSKPFEINQKKSINHNISEGFTLKEQGANQKEIAFLFDLSGNGNSDDEENYSPFDHALFSGGGQEFVIQGTSQIIIGPVHTNGSLKIATADFECYDYDEFNNRVNDNVISSVSEDMVKSGDNFKVASDAFNLGVDPRPMPDYADTITNPEKSKVAKDGKTIWINDYVGNDPSKNKMTKAQFEDYINKNYNNINPNDLKGSPSLLKPLSFLRYYNPNTALRVKEDSGKIFLETEGGDYFVVPDDTILRISTNFRNGAAKGIEFKGTGYLIAEGDIIQNGGEIKTYPKDTEGLITSEQGKEENASAFIYSRNGNVKISTGNTDYYGIVYAPNGQVDIQGQNVNVFGSVVGKVLGSIPGNLKITHTAGTAPDSFIPDPPLTHFDLAKNAVLKYINDIDSSDPTDIHILTYNNEAKTEYSGTAPTDKLMFKSEIGKIEVINNGYANLGDGIRQATNLLDNGKVASKSIVVISGSAPNKWTEDDKGKYFFGQDYEYSNVKDNAIKAKKYAEEAINRAANLSIVTLFFNYLPDEIDDPASKLQVPPKIVYDKWEYADKAIREILDGVIAKKPDLFTKLKGIDSNKLTADSFYKSANKDDLTDAINNTLSTLSINYTMQIEAEFYSLLPVAVKLSDVKLLPSNLESSEVTVNKVKRVKITSKDRVKTTLTGVLDEDTGLVTYSVNGNKDLAVFNNMLIKDLKFLYNKNFVIDKNKKNNRTETRVFLPQDTYISFTVNSTTGYAEQDVVLDPVQYNDLAIDILYKIDLN